MKLQAGTAITFKGQQAQDRCNTWAVELHGACRQESPTKLVMTVSVDLRPTQFLRAVRTPVGGVDRAPLFSLLR